MPFTETDLNIPASSQGRNATEVMTNESIESIVNRAISGLQIGLSGNLSSISTTINDLSSKVDNLSSKVDYVISITDNHSRRIAALEGTIEHMNVNSLSGNCMAEIQDRLSRSCNLILFGLPEKNIKPNVNSGENILSMVKELFSKFSSSNLVDKAKIFRIGSFKQMQQHPRSIKIVCESEENARSLHMLFLKAKKNDVNQSLLLNMRLSRDMTKMQI